jgi:TetR/AcrR family transcriptional regulator
LNRQANVRRRDATRSKASILNAAISEFASRGPAGTRVEEIAARAGVNKSLIYQYFGSKNELYTEALTSVIMTVTQKAVEYSEAFLADALGGDVRGYVRGFLAYHLSLLEAVPEYPRLMAWENLEGGHTLARLPLNKTYHAFLNRVRRSLQPLIDQGIVKSDFNVAHVAQAVMALMHFFVVQRGSMQHLFQVDPLSREVREEWLERSTNMLLALFAPVQIGARKMRQKV